MEIKETKPKKYDTAQAILNWIAAPRSIKERKARYTEIVAEMPFVKKIIDAHFFPTDTFVNVMSVKDDALMKKMKYFHEVDARTFIEREVSRYADSFTKMTPERKWAQLTYVFNYMHEDDATFFYALLNGEWIGPSKINALFLKSIDKENKTGK